MEHVEHLFNEPVEQILSYIEVEEIDASLVTRSQCDRGNHHF
jgi:hypothetical protein